MVPIHENFDFSIFQTASKPLLELGTLSSVLLCSITSRFISAATRRELIFFIPMVQMLWGRLLVASCLPSSRVQKFYLMSGGG